MGKNLKRLGFYQKNLSSMKAKVNQPSVRLVIARITYFIVPIKAPQYIRKFLLRGYGWRKKPSSTWSIMTLPGATPVLSVSI